MSVVISAQFHESGLAKTSLHTRDTHARITLRGHLTFCVNRGYAILRDLMGNEKPWYVSHVTYDPYPTCDSDSLLTMEARYK